MNNFRESQVLTHYSAKEILHMTLPVALLYLGVYAIYALGGEKGLNYLFVSAVLFIHAISLFVAAVKLNKIYKSRNGPRAKIYGYFISGAIELTFSFYFGFKCVQLIGAI